MNNASNKNNNYSKKKGNKAQRNTKDGGIPQRGRVRRPQRSGRHRVAMLNDMDYSRRVFVGGIDHKTDKKSLINYFSKFGKILNAEIIRHKDTGKSKHYAFLFCKNQETVKKILGKSHSLFGKVLDVNEAYDRREVRKRNWGDDGKSRSLYITKVHNHTAEKDLRQYFEQYGSVRRAYVVKKESKNSGRNQWYGLVQFFSPYSLDSVFQVKVHRVKGAKVLCFRDRNRLKKNQMHEACAIKEQNFIDSEISRIYGEDADDSYYSEYEEEEEYSDDYHYYKDGEEEEEEEYEDGEDVIFSEEEIPEYCMRSEDTRTIKRKVIELPRKKRTLIPIVKIETPAKLQPQKAASSRQNKVNEKKRSRKMSVVSPDGKVESLNAKKSQVKDRLRKKKKEPAEEAYVKKVAVVKKKEKEEPKKKLVVKKKGEDTPKIKVRTYNSHQEEEEFIPKRVASPQKAIKEKKKEPKKVKDKPVKPKEVKKVEAKAVEIPPKPLTFAQKFQKAIWRVRDSSIKYYPSSYAPKEESKKKLVLGLKHEDGNIRLNHQYFVSDFWIGMTNPAKSVRNFELSSVLVGEETYRLEALCALLGDPLNFVDDNFNDNIPKMEFIVTKLRDIASDLDYELKRFFSSISYAEQALGISNETFVEPKKEEKAKKEETTQKEKKKVAEDKKKKREQSSTKAKGNPKEKTKKSQKEEKAKDLEKQKVKKKQTSSVKNSKEAQASKKKAYGRHNSPPKNRNTSHRKAETVRASSHYNKNELRKDWYVRREEERRRSSRNNNYNKYQNSYIKKTNDRKEEQMPRQEQNPRHRQERNPRHRQERNPRQKSEQNPRHREEQNSKMNKCPREQSERQSGQKYPENNRNSTHNKKYKNSESQRHTQVQKPPQKYETKKGGSYNSEPKPNPISDYHSEQTIYVKKPKQRSEMGNQKAIQSSRSNTEKGGPTSVKPNRNDQKKSQSRSEWNSQAQNPSKPQPRDTKNKSSKKKEQGSSSKAKNSRKKNDKKQAKSKENNKNISRKPQELAKFNNAFSKKQASSSNMNNQPQNLKSGNQSQQHLLFNYYLEDEDEFDSYEEEDYYPENNLTYEEQMRIYEQKLNMVGENEYNTVITRQRPQYNNSDIIEEEDLTYNPAFSNADNSVYQGQNSGYGQAGQVSQPHAVSYNAGQREIFNKQQKKDQQGTFGNKPITPKSGYGYDKSNQYFQANAQLQNQNFPNHNKGTNQLAGNAPYIANSAPMGFQPQIVPPKVEKKVRESVVDKLLPEKLRAKKKGKKKSQGYKVF